MSPPNKTDTNATPVTVVVEPNANSETNPPPPPSSTPAYLINILQNIFFNLPGPALRHAYGRQYLQRVIMPQCTLAFIISCLMELLQIKSQSQHTNLLLLRLAVVSLIIYGLASAIEPAVPVPAPAPVAAALDRTSVVARWARIDH